ncbi:unnamed protein product [marine sediment metagenome]|uniref:Uncharacterized protein n=1 Tax=marine sediment metagenome TaxID=412755 RepID=X1SIX7_9ZZZZ
MANDELNPLEKSGLLAVKDLTNPDHYDKKFYKLLSTQRFPGPLEIDDQIRPAIAKFIEEAWESLHSTFDQPEVISKEVVATAMTGALLTGYELGRKLRRPLTAKPAASR